jgi:integrase
MRLLMGISKNRHGTYYAIKKVPVRLQEAVAGVLGKDKPRQVWLKRTLGTKDSNEANRRAKAVLIEFDRIIERAEERLAARPLRATLTDAEIKLIADYHYASTLHDDDERTREGTGRDAMMRSIAAQLDAAGVPYRMLIPPSEHTPQYGMSQSEVLRREADLEFLLPIMRAALTTGDISKVSEPLDYLLNDVFGINLDRQSEAYRRLGMALLRKDVAALEVIKRRAEGQPIEGPPLPPVDARTTPSGEILRAALEGWKRQRERPAATITEYERAISLFVELHGDLPVVQVKRSHARLFREALQEVPRTRSGKLLKASLPELAQWGREHPGAQKISASTVNKLLGGVQAVAVWARDNGMVPDDVQWADPFAKMRLGEGEARRGGAPFELADLQVIFSSPVFTQGERPKGGQGEAAFWFPLLALFTGARLGELAGLRASDVARDDTIGAVSIYITADARAGKRLKTRQSARVVPVHAQLNKIGFLKFVAAQGKARGSGAWLFPEVAPRTPGAKAFSKWFGRYIGTHGVTDATKVFHSFRHTFIDALRAAGVSKEINSALVGHSNGGVHEQYGAKEIARRYGKRLSDAVALVRYAGLDLSHLTNHRAPKGRKRTVKAAAANKKERK